MTTDFPTGRWVRAKAAARYLGIGRTSLWRYFKCGRLPQSARRKLSRGVVLYDLDALDAFVKMQQ